MKETNKTSAALKWARFALLQSLYHSLSLCALSYAPLGTIRSDDTKENGVKTLPNCCYCFCFVLLLFDICEQNVLPNRHGAGQREKERQIRQLCRWLFIFLFVFSLIPRHCRCCCCYRFPHAHFVFLFTTQPAFLSCDVCRVYLLGCACLSVCVRITRALLHAKFKLKGNCNW